MRWPARREEHVVEDAAEKIEFLGMTVLKVGTYSRKSCRYKGLAEISEKNGLIQSYRTKSVRSVLVPPQQS